MNRTVLPALIAVLLLCTPLWALTGREIMEKNDALPEFKTADSTVLMNIYKGKEVIEKEFEMKAKQMKDDEDAIIISFIRPTQITLLTHTFKDQDDDQWLKLSSGKVKRIRNHPRVRVMPCGVRGEPRGEWVEGQARFASADESKKVNGLLTRKYGLMKAMFELMGQFQGRKYTVIAINETPEV